METIKRPWSGQQSWGALCSYKGQKKKTKSGGTHVRRRFQGSSASLLRDIKHVRHWMDVQSQWENMERKPLYWTLLNIFTSSACSYTSPASWAEAFDIHTVTFADFRKQVLKIKLFFFIKAGSHLFLWCLFTACRLVSLGSITYISLDKLVKMSNSCSPEDERSLTLETWSSGRWISSSWGC